MSLEWFFCMLFDKVIYSIPVVFLNSIQIVIACAHSQAMYTMTVWATRTDTFCRWASQVGWLVGWGLTALLTQNKSYRACKFVGIFHSKL